MGEWFENIIKWILDNIGLLILCAVTISIAIPISIHFGKNITINNSNKNINNNYNNTQNKNQHHSHKNSYTHKHDYSNIELISVGLYSIGKKGKILTDTFYKLLNRNFGIEVAFKNKISNLQNVKMKWHIYKNDKKIYNKVFYAKVKGHTTYRRDFYVKPNIFAKMQIGKYQSVFFINGVQVHNKSFTITKK